MDVALVFTGVATLIFALLMVLAYLYMEHGSILDPIPAAWAGFIAFVSGGLLTTGFYSPNRGTQEYSDMGVFLSILAMLAFAFGVFAGSGRGLARFLPVPSAKLDSGQVFLMWVLAAAAMVTFIVLDAVIPSGLVNVVRGLLSGALGALILLSLFCLLSHRSFALKLLMVPTLFACIAFVLNNVWSRRPLLGIAVAAAAYFYRAKLAHRSFGIRATSMMAIVFSGLLLLQFLTVTRGERFYGDASGRSESMFSAAGLRHFLSGIEINYLVYEYALSEFPRNENYLVGSGFVPAFLFVIPRSIWEDKPISSGAVITAMWYNDDHAANNLSPSLIGECYMNFGVPGVAILMFICGKLTRALNTFMRAHNYNAVAWLAWLLILPDFATEWRGDFTSMTVQPFLRVSVFLALAWLVAKLQGQPAGPTVAPYPNFGPPSAHVTRSRRPQFPI